jgi:hypothetical protein
VISGNKAVRIADCAFCTGNFALSADFSGMKSQNLREKCGFQQNSEISTTALTLVTISY